MLRHVFTTKLKCVVDGERGDHGAAIGVDDVLVAAHGRDHWRARGRGRREASYRRGKVRVVPDDH